MSDWEQTARNRLAETGDIDLDVIGGFDSIPDTAVGSPLFPQVGEAVVASFSNLTDDQRQRARRMLSEATSATSSGLALRSLCDVLVPAASDLGVVDQLKSVLRGRVTDRSDDSRAALASIALKALCHLALLQPSARFLLFDALSAVSADEPGLFATTASWVAGVTFDRWREDAAAECLERLLTSDGEADASFWLGQTLLVRALELDATDDIRTALRGTLPYFDRAAAQGEDRPDAVMYAATVRFITDYAVEADTARLTAHLDVATTAFQQYLIDGVGMPGLPDWMRPRYDAEARWVELLERLQAATDAEQRDTWYQPPQMIDALANAYTAAHTLTPSRTYLTDGRRPTVVVEAVLPRIASPFINDIVPLAYLDAWLTRTEHPDAAEFRNAITARVNEGVNRGKGPTAGDYPAVTRLLGTLPKVDPQALAQVEHLLEDRDSDRAARTDLVVTELLETIHDGLVTCSDFTGDVRTYFTIVIDQVIRFLHLRMNVQRGSAGGRFAYLYDPNAHERLLGQDLGDFVYGNVPGVIHHEVQEMGGGRTDLIVQFNGFRITIELKREKADVSRSGLAGYLPQLAAYESTDVALGMLVVLDLTDKPTGPANIRDNVWVHRLPGPNSGDRDRYAVIVRVPGNRKAPSEL